MSKRLLVAILSVLFLQTLNAQNGIDVGIFDSPQIDFVFNSNTIEDISIRILNEGPVILAEQDSMRFDVSISEGNTTNYYQIKKRINQTLSPGDRATYVLFKDYQFLGDNSFVICASVSGTDDYPSNTTKNASNCVSGVVGVEDEKIDIESFYYSENRIYFDLKKSAGLTALVFDLTGKLLLEKRLNAAENQSLEFSSPAKGFYFLKVRNSEGQFSIKKFVVN